MILDRDGTLTGYTVVDTSGAAAPGRYPISLNNLAFNGTPYTVDECHSTGAQDALREHRGTSLISPHAYATLEMTAFDPTFDFRTGLPVTQLSKKTPITITKDQLDYVGTAGEAHHSMTLVGRNDTQVREPKVISGLGYTLSSTEQGVVVGADGPTLITSDGTAFPRYMSIGFTDATGEVNPVTNLLKKPFKVRLGICYQSARGPDVGTIDPSRFFEVKKGRQSYGDPQGGATDASAYRQIPDCNNLAYRQGPGGGANFDPTGAKDPSAIMPGCPSTLDATNDPVKTLTQAPTWADFLSASIDDDDYFWDGQKGMLFFYATQKEGNAEGFSPIGSSQTGREFGCANAQGFYTCPAQGCVLYTVRVVDRDQIGYAPTVVGNDYGPTTCDAVYDPQGSQTASPPTDYTQDYPLDLDQLALLSGTALSPDRIQQVGENVVNGVNYPYNIPKAGF